MVSPRLSRCWESSLIVCWLWAKILAVCVLNEAVGNSDLHTALLLRCGWEKNWGNIAQLWRNAQPMKNLILVLCSRCDVFCVEIRGCNCVIWNFFSHFCEDYFFHVLGLVVVWIPCSGLAEHPLDYIWSWWCPGFILKLEVQFGHLVIVCGQFEISEGCFMFMTLSMNCVIESRPSGWRGFVHP